MYYSNLKLTLILSFSFGLIIFGLSINPFLSRITGSTQIKSSPNIDQIQIFSNSIEGLIIIVPREGTINLMTAFGSFIFGLSIEIYSPFAHFSI